MTLQTPHQNFWPACEQHISDLQDLVNWLQWQPYLWVATLITELPSAWPAASSWLWLDLAYIQVHLWPASSSPLPSESSQVAQLVTPGEPWAPEFPGLWLYFSDTRGHLWAGLTKRTQQKCPQQNIPRPLQTTHTLTHQAFTNICARPSPRDPSSRSHSKVGDSGIPTITVQSGNIVSGTVGAQGQGQAPPPPRPEGMKVHPGTLNGRASSALLPTLKTLGKASLAASRGSPKLVFPSID